MKYIKPLIIISLSLIIFSCEEGAEEPPASVDFEEPINGRNINLAQKVGESFQVLRDKDTITYHLSYDKKTKLNYLLKSAYDTVFVGTVTKRKELYLLNHLLKNGNYSIHALKFTDTTVTGLETEWIQSAIIKNELDSGQYNDLVTDTIGINTLKAKKKDGKELFRLVIEQLKPEKLILPEKDITPPFINENNDIGKNFHKDSIVVSGLIHKAYPNPFKDKMTISLYKDSPYVFKVFDQNGRLIITIKQKCKELEIDLKKLSKGTYFLKVYSEEFDKGDVIKLVKLDS